MSMTFLHAEKHASGERVKRPCHGRQGDSAVAASGSRLTSEGRVETDSVFPIVYSSAFESFSQLLLIHDLASSIPANDSNNCYNRHLLLDRQTRSSFDNVGMQWREAMRP